MHKFNLVENAEDSLRHAMKHMKAYEGTGDRKRVITDIAHVVELLLKEKLRQIHPVLIYSNIDNYPKINQHTVTGEVAYMRLKNIGGIHFNPEDEVAIHLAQKKRNEILHFEVTISTKESDALVNRLLLFIFSFSNIHLGLDWANIYRPLYRNTQHYQSHLEEVCTRIEVEEIAILTCTFCYRDAFAIEEEKCMACSYSEEVLECTLCAEPFLYSANDEYAESGDYFGAVCPKCIYEGGYA